MAGSASGSTTLPGSQHQGIMDITDIRHQDRRGHHFLTVSPQHAAEKDAFLKEILGDVIFFFGGGIGYGNRR
jgi:hypothetical protein